MSASDKKKLRKEEKAAVLSEKQLKEKAEAKKLKATSITFVVIMIAVVLVAASVMLFNIVNSSGIIDRNTIAAATGDHEINSVQLNYYYTDAIQNTVSSWQSAYGDNLALYTSMMGLDLTKPLDEQVYDDETGDTWADYFMDMALEQVRSEYRLYDLAKADGYTLSADEQAQFKYNMQNIDFYAQIYGYSKTDDYLKSYYGFGSDMESYTEYRSIATLASSYYSKYKNELAYTDEDIRNYEKDKEVEYSHFDYATYYVSVSSYQEGGSKDEHGHTVYTEEEKAAAIAKAKAIADELATNDSVVTLDKAIKALEINAENEGAATSKYADIRYAQITEVFRDWLTEEGRVENEIKVFENKVASSDAHAEEGEETVGGYYVVVYQDRDDNMRHLANVRHLLVQFTGGTKDEDGHTVYSDEEKAAAKKEAESYLKEWADGAATEESFIELVKEHSDDGSASTGGLYEDIHKESDYVPNFLNWSIDEARKAGDTEVIETEYGYHVMFYVGDDDLTYRDYLIQEDMRDADTDEWYEGLLKDITITKLNTSRLHTDLVLGN